MRLVTVLDHGERRAGVLADGEVLVTALPGGLDGAIAQGLGPAELASRAQRSVAPEEAVLDAPLRPPVVFCTGQNYADHLSEKAPVVVDEPEFFLKAGQTIAAPGEPCVRDETVTKKLDYETELGVVIGRAGRNIPPERALDHVYGYVVVNDLSARDRQVVILGEGRYGSALGPGKNFDGATRLAPWVTSAGDLPGAESLSLTTRVNDELRQSTTTGSMLFPVPALIAFVSSLLTLPPASVIATGTPGGTGWGRDAELGGTGRTPPGCAPARYLVPGDTVVSEIERVGVLEFEVTPARQPPNAPA
jgi:2-keto-4-pentenoate hydratase/2-oxohepta-3-ene-1,7-dioic acid hydratase in catechol pathway